MKTVLLAICSIVMICCTKELSTSNTSLEEGPLFVVAGQSNAVGLGDAVNSIQLDLPCFEYSTALGAFTKLKDPIGQEELAFERATSGSLSPSLAYTYSSLTGRTVYLVQTARGGSALVPAAEIEEGLNWSDSSYLFSNSLLKIDFSIDRISNSENIDIVMVWSQGENDGRAIGEGIITENQYERALRYLIERYTLKYGDNFSFVIIETGRNTLCQPCDFGNEKVREAQRRVAASLSNTYIGYDKTKDFIELGWLKDPVHYNQEALNDIGYVVANFIADNIL